MSPNADEQAAMARIMLAHAPVRLEIERRVCGCDYGGTSWTTVDEARQAAGLLRLGPGKRLLDIGAGSGCNQTWYGSSRPVVGISTLWVRARLGNHASKCSK